jgi:hypothetical protein
MARMMAGNTRRMMTQLRISDNIVKRNDPRNENIFNDILVSSAVGSKVSDPELDAQIAEMASAGI